MNIAMYGWRHAADPVLTATREDSPPLTLRTIAERSPGLLPPRYALDSLVSPRGEVCKPGE